MKARPYFSKPPAGFRPRRKSLAAIADSVLKRPLIERSTNADGSVDVQRLTIAIPFSAWRALNEAKAPRRRKKP